MKSLKKKNVYISWKFSSYLKWEDEKYADGSRPSCFFSVQYENWAISICWDLATVYVPVLWIA